MNTKRFCDLAHVSHGTFRNWTAIFAPFLSPQAAPAKGKARVLSDHDLRVLYLVSTLRDTGLGIEDITARLRDLQRADWSGLPDIPSEWEQPGETVSVGVAVSKAYDVAQIAVLQRDLEYTRLELQNALERAELLQNELNTLRTDKVAAEGRVHVLELELSQTRGEVSELRAKIDAFTFAYSMGQSRPVPVFVIIAVALLAGAVLVVLAVLVGALVG